MTPDIMELHRRLYKNKIDAGLEEAAKKEKERIQARIASINKGIGHQKEYSDFQVMSRGYSSQGGSFAILQS
jgi:hypothetical protein